MYFYRAWTHMHEDGTDFHVGSDAENPLFSSLHVVRFSARHCLVGNSAFSDYFDLILVL